MMNTGQQEKSVTLFATEPEGFNAEASAPFRFLLAYPVRLGSVAKLWNPHFPLPQIVVSSHSSQAVVVINRFCNRAIRFSMANDRNNRPQTRTTLWLFILCFTLIGLCDIALGLYMVLYGEYLAVLDPIAVWLFGFLHDSVWSPG
jgi:hypothetical protein